MKKSWIKIILISSTFLGASSAFAEFYRYKDKDGHSVITNSLPAEAANAGYEIVNQYGAVIEKVAPKKSPEQLEQEAKALAEKQKQEAITRQIQQEQDKNDEILLKTFNTQADIDRAKKDKIASIVVLEGIITENLEGVRKQLQLATTTAKEYEKNKQPIPANLQHTIDESNRQIKKDIDFLARKQIEKKNIENQYEVLRQRFLELQAQKQKNATPKESFGSHQKDIKP